MWDSWQLMLIRPACRKAPVLWSLFTGHFTIGLENKTSIVKKAPVLQSLPDIYDFTMGPENYRPLLFKGTTSAIPMMWQVKSLCVRTKVR